MDIIEENKTEKLLKIYLLQNYNQYTNVFREVIDEILSCEHKRWVDVVSIKEINYIHNTLNLLIKIYPKFEKKLEWYRDKINEISLIYDENGNWHPINKLNTNKLDSINFIADLLMNPPIEFDVDMGLRNLKRGQKNYITDFLHKVKEYKSSVYNTHFSDFNKYTSNNLINTIDGDIVEDMIIDHYSKQGWVECFRGGNGNPIDMKLGIDIILKKNDEYMIIQAKGAKINIENVNGKDYYVVYRNINQDINFVITHTIFGDSDDNIVSIDRKNGYFLQNRMLGLDQQFKLPSKNENVFYVLKTK